MASSNTRKSESEKRNKSTSVNLPDGKMRAKDQEAERQALARDEDSNAAARHRLIQIAAYYIAQRRGFAPGSDIEDWLSAEAEVDAAFRGESH
jgi:hypothetical protein